MCLGTGICKTGLSLHRKEPIPFLLEGTVSQNCELLYPSLSPSAARPSTCALQLDFILGELYFSSLRVSGSDSAVLHYSYFDLNAADG